VRGKYCILIMKFMYNRNDNGIRPHSFNQQSVSLNERIGESSAPFFHKTRVWRSVAGMMEAQPKK